MVLGASVAYRKEPCSGAIFLRSVGFSVTATVVVVAGTRTRPTRPLSGCLT